MTYTTKDLERLVRVLNNRTGAALEPYTLTDGKCPRSLDALVLISHSPAAMFRSVNYTGSSRRTSQALRLPNARNSKSN